MTDIATTDNRVAGQTELARAQEAERAALSRVATLETELARLQSEQIEASDPRLTMLWAKVRRIADHAGYESYYDTLAEELGGVQRERQYTVTYRVTIEVDVPVEVTAINTITAEEAARPQLTPERISTILHGPGWRDMTVQEHDITEL
ncbi:hypothetical protein [Microbacterium algeriense]|uniref:hypothetical protein n=1 Tax=Microbacterium algeriense TaxID=2615184 RepID=UPI0022E50005|nr:hypothetical protein [Microbacterium algeriense]